MTTTGNEDQILASQKLAAENGLGHANFRRASVYEPNLLPQSLDIAYCRWLMVHLNRPVDAMRAIYSVLKPGGVMVCEEAGVSAVAQRVTYPSPQPNSAKLQPGKKPARRSSSRVASSWISLMTRRQKERTQRGWTSGRDSGVDYDGGRYAHLWAKQAGFELIDVTAYQPHYLNGPHKGFWNWTLRNATLRLIDEGSLSEGKWRELVAGMTEADNSPDTVVAHCRMHQLIAKKPAIQPGSPTAQ